MRPPLLIILTIVPGLLLSPMLPAEPVELPPRIEDVSFNTFGVMVEVWDADEVEAVLVADTEGNTPKLIEKLRSKTGREEWKYEFQYRSGFAPGSGKFRLTIHAYSRKGEAVSRNFKIEL